VIRAAASTTGGPTAAEFERALLAKRSPAELPVMEKRLGPGDDAFGIRMRDLFDTARQAMAMPLVEVEQLFASDLYEVRMGAVCILDFRAKAPRCEAGERERLYGLYLGRHDRITTWDMVDRAAPSVVGGHLLTRSWAPLHELAESADPLRRRTAVTAPLWFVRYGSSAELGHALPLAGLLAADPEPVVHLAVGTLLKHLGGRDPGAVRAFLEEHAAVMPRTAVRTALVKTGHAHEAARSGRSR